jgi:cell division protein FtsI/penicillin-binding protein 2
MFNRPFHEQRAPGSTFKMVTAVAGLEYGVVTPNTRIFDNFIFTKAGGQARCNSRHGNVNMELAISCSCNYYFYEVAHRLGNAAENTMLQGIGRLNRYMVLFGMGSPTGVEISDIYNRLNSGLPEGIFPISSPEYRLFLNQNQGRRIIGWSGADTIRTAIGQADNSITSSVMAKYTATLASGGVRYRMHFLSHIQSYDGTVLRRTEPVVEDIVPMSRQTVNAVHRGMLACTSSPRGTGFHIFRDFPVQVAGKTGTAQEGNWPNHSSFSAFAPYDNPAVAVYVLLPGSVQSHVRAPAALVARDILAVYFKLDSEIQRPQGLNILVLN